MYVQIRFKALILMFNTLELQTSCFIKFKRKRDILLTLQTCLLRNFGATYLFTKPKEKTMAAYLQSVICV